METISLISLILVGVMALLLVYAAYIASKTREKKPMAVAPSEPKPSSASIETPKSESAQPVEELKPQPPQVEAPKTEPVEMISPKPQSVVIEAPKPEPNNKPMAESKLKSAKQPMERERNFSIISIEGIGKVNSKKLHAINIYHTSELLKAGATPNGRRELADKTGISEKLILKWVNLSDLFRIKGIGEEYSDLLEEAGVDTVVELSHRNAENLHAKILEVNEAKKLVRRTPSLASVERWIREAKTLPRIIEY